MICNKLDAITFQEPCIHFLHANAKNTVYLINLLKASLPTPCLDDGDHETEENVGLLQFIYSFQY